MNDIRLNTLDRMGESYLFKFEAMQDYDKVEVKLNNTLINTFSPQSAGQFIMNVDKSTLLHYGDDILILGTVGTFVYEFKFKAMDYVQTILSTGEQLNQENGKQITYYPDGILEYETFMYVNSDVDLKGKGVLAVQPEILDDPDIGPVKDLVPYLCPYPVYDYERGYNDGFILGRYSR